MCFVLVRWNVLREFFDGIGEAKVGIKVRAESEEG